MAQYTIDKRGFFDRIGYEPHPKQWLYHNSTSRFRLPNCGRRFGKSTMAGRDLEPELFLPNKMFWIIGPTYDLGEKEFRVVWDDLIVKMRLGKDKTIRRAYNKKQGNMFIQFPWNTTLAVRSADHPENLVGEALDRVIMSEAAKHKPDTWERFIRPALADRRGGADFPTTPEGFNWLHGLWMLGQDKTLPDYESWRFPSWDNSAVYPGGFDDPEIQLLKRTMTTEAFDQEIGADFSSFVGKIYPEWDAGVHVDNVEFRPELPNYIAFDWGYTNPLAAIEFQITPQDEVRIWREHYKSYTTLPDHLRMMKNRDQPPGYHLDLAFGDAADPEAAAQVSAGLVQCWALPDAKTNWRAGVDLVRSFLAPRETGLYDEFGGPLYKPALVVDFSCTNTIKEWNNYKAPGTPRSGNNVPEMAQKQDDHAMDAIRYGLVHIYHLGCLSHLSDILDLNNVAQTSQVTREVASSSGSALDSGSSGYFTTGSLSNF